VDLAIKTVNQIKIYNFYSLALKRHDKELKTALAEALTIF